MIRKLLALPVLLFALVVPAQALANGQADAGNVSFKATTDQYDGACAGVFTTNNGSNYQLRCYFQTNETGTYTISSTASVWNFAPPANNTTYVRHFVIGCQELNSVGGFNVWSSVRVKAVLENMVTHTTDIAFGPGRARAKCNSPA